MTLKTGKNGCRQTRFQNWAWHLTFSLIIFFCLSKTWGSRMKENCFRVFQMIYWTKSAKSFAKQRNVTNKFSATVNLQKHFKTNIPSASARDWRGGGSRSETKWRNGAIAEPRKARFFAQAKNAPWWTFCPVFETNRPIGNPSFLWYNFHYGRYE